MDCDVDCHNCEKNREVMTYSLYLIGSRARGDSHELSDVDYVCIHEGRKPTLHLPYSGNVSYYTPGRMMWMVKNSKLFVKHVLEDGIAINENSKHRAIISSFRIDASILTRDLLCFKSMLSCLGWIPPGDAGRMWACDYIYAVSRNILYISNALNGFYDFGYERALKFFFRNSDYCYLSDFLLIRDGKYRYRSNGSGVPEHCVASMARVCQSLIGDPISIAIGGKSSLIVEQRVSYETLRLVERAVINREVEDDGFVARLKSHGEYFFLLRTAAKKILLKLNR